jgi:hypothetical protein
MKYKGIEYARTPLNNELSRAKWDGGAVGGQFFESKAGQFGDASQWHDTFEHAADIAQMQRRRTYDLAKSIVDKYESELPK